MTIECYCDTKTPPVQHIVLFNNSSFADKLYRMTKASPDLLSYANGWCGKQLTSLFIHSFRMSGLCLHHWNAALV